MKVSAYQSVPAIQVDMEGAQGCRVRWLLSEKDGAPNFAMRHFEIEPGGHTPRHRHDYEHEVFVLEGRGIVYEGDQPRAIKSGDVVLVSPNEVHQFANTGTELLTVLCLIPNSATDKRVQVVPECGLETRCE